MHLLNSFFPSDEMSISSWVKLEFALASPDLLLFTQSPEHSDKPLHEWVQYLLHQRTETNNLAKTQRHVDTSGGVTIASASDHAEYHLTEQFLKSVSTIRKVTEVPIVGLLLRFGWLLCQLVYRCCNNGSVGCQCR